MLTETQIALVQSSFATIAPSADDAAALFYNRLFEIDPSLRQMFKGDMAEQRRKLMQMLSAAVKGLQRLDRLVPVVEDLGRRHAGYGGPTSSTPIGAAPLRRLPYRCFKALPYPRLSSRSNSRRISDLNGFADVLVPERRMLPDELLHHLNALIVLHDVHSHATRTQQLFFAEEGRILADDDVGNPIEQDGAAAHRAR